MASPEFSYSVKPEIKILEILKYKTRIQRSSYDGGGPFNSAILVL